MKLILRDLRNNCAIYVQLTLYLEDWPKPLIYKVFLNKKAS